MPDAPSLATWLRQQLDLDRDLALAADKGPWTFSVGVGRHASGGIAGHDWTIVADFDHSVTGANVDHMTRWDPAAVLADLDAKLRIVELHARPHECSGYDHQGEIDNCRWHNDFETCSTLRLIAVLYAHRPGYRDEWRL